MPTLKTTHPELEPYWSETNEKDFNSITTASGYKAEWVCIKRHTWKAKVYHITGSNSWCPFCAGQRSWKGETDLATLYPEISKEWHPTKNLNLNPDEVRPGAKKRVWWLCNLGHEWEAVIYSRTGTLKTGCPYCVNKSVLKGFNDLRTTEPELSMEWHPTKNAKTNTPETVTRMSDRIVWWQCSKHNNHEWKSSIGNRTAGKGCPMCNRRDSRIQKEIQNFISSLLNDTLTSTNIKNPRTGKSLEVDIYIPKMFLGIEVNGIYWHSEKIKPDKLYHQNKRKLANEQGIRLFTIWEDEWLYDQKRIKTLLSDVVQGKVRKYKENEVIIDLDKEWGPDLESQGYEFLEEIEPEIRIRKYNEQKHRCWNSGLSKYRKVNTE